MAVEKHATLKSLRQSILGTSDSWEYLGARSGRPIKLVRKAAQRDGGVVVHSWNDRLGYRGLTLCTYHPRNGWEVADEVFDQNDGSTKAVLWEALDPYSKLH